MQAEELNIEVPTALEPYLAAQGYCGAGEVTEHEVLAGGVSSRTVRVAFADGRQWVLKQALPKLRVQSDWFSDPRRVHREAEGMQVLAELAPPGAIPELVFDDQRHHVLGMRAVPRPHENWKTQLLAGRIDPDAIRQFAELLGTIHSASWLRRTELALRFADRTFFETLRVEPYYETSAAHEPSAANFYQRLIADTRATRVALVHGDYSPKNVLIHAGRLILLDHEVIHWGDPAFDVGFALTHLLSKAHHLAEHSPCLIAAAHAWWDRYQDVMSVTAIPEQGSAEQDSAEQGAHADKLPFSLERCARHALGCLLARVVGRSPLEYLSADERDRQRGAVLRLIAQPPQSVHALIDRFVSDVAKQATPSNP